MTLRASARCCAGTFRPRHQEERSGTVLDARRMSTSTSAFVLAAASRKKSSRKSSRNISSAALRSQGLCWAAPGRSTPISSPPASIRRWAARRLMRPSSSGRPRSRHARRRRRSTRCSPLCRRRRRFEAREPSRLRLCLTKGLQPPRRRANRRGSPPHRRRPMRPSLPRHRSRLTRRSSRSAEAIVAPKLPEAPKTEQASAFATSRAQPRAAASPPRQSPPQRSPATSVRDMAQRAKAAVMSIASGEKQNDGRKALGQAGAGDGRCCRSPPPTPASPAAFPRRSAQNPMLGGSPPYDRQTAVYDISAHTVYLPDGTRLEAHSGLGSKIDDPRFSHMRMSRRDAAAHL